MFSLVVLNRLSSVGLEIRLVDNIAIKSVLIKISRILICIGDKISLFIVNAGVYLFQTMPPTTPSYTALTTR